MVKKIIKRIEVRFYEGEEETLEKFLKIKKILKMSESKTAKAMVKDFDFGLKIID